jgi:hypothetical protein
LDILSKFGQGRKNIVENKKEHFIKEVRKSEKGICTLYLGNSKRMKYM